MMIDPAPAALADVLASPWLEAVLATEAPITDVHVVEKIRVSATKVRFVARQAQRTEALCVKGFFDNDLNPRAAEISACEARFYNEIAPAAGLRLPVRRHAAVSPATGHGVLLMDDVIARGGSFLTVLEPYTPAQVAETLGQLARLHAAHWDKPSLASFEWLVSRLDWLIDTPLVSKDELQALMSGARGDPLPEAVRDAGRIMAGLAMVRDRVRGQPACIVHGDAHAGNVFRLNGQLGFVDWQLVARGSWSLDVAYHLGVALSVEDRRATEQDLIRHYLSELQAAGASPPSFAEAWLAYRTQLVYGFNLWAVTRRVDPVITQEMVRRLGLAVAEHDSFGLLGV